MTQLVTFLGYRTYSFAHLYRHLQINDSFGSSTECVGFTWRKHQGGQTILRAEFWWVRFWSRMIPALDGGAVVAGEGSWINSNKSQLSWTSTCQLPFLPAYLTLIQREDLHYKSSKLQIIMRDFGSLRWAGAPATTGIKRIQWVAVLSWSLACSSARCFHGM